MRITIYLKNGDRMVFKKPAGKHLSGSIDGLCYVVSTNDTSDGYRVTDVICLDIIKRIELHYK